MKHQTFNHPRIQASQRVTLSRMFANIQASDSSAMPFRKQKKQLEESRSALRQDAWATSRTLSLPHSGSAIFLPRQKLVVLTGL